MRSLPAGVESRFVETGETRLHYLTGGAGPPVVLLHGGGLDSAELSWRETIPALTESHTVYAPDLPGYGRSAPPSTQPSVGGYVAVLGSFLDAVGVDRAALVGISMGGAIALGFALDHPDRVGRIVAVDSYGLGGTVPGGALSVAFTRIPYLSGLTWALLRRSRRLTAATLGGIVARGNRTPALVDEVYEELQRPGGAEAWRAFQREEVGFDGLRTNYVERLPDLSMPALFVHGERDPLVPVAWSVRASTLAPDADVRVLRDCGHWPPRERPEAFNAVIQPFLSPQSNIPVDM
jgi:pimeloyl-ACP methyl ester carboxylesterase